MRLMLGTGSVPSLLVDVVNTYNPTDFKFDVVNGGWSGRFVDGTVHVDGDHGEPIGGVNILADNQDRLRGDYPEVFNNFDNPDWIAPIEPWSTKEQWARDDWDDDVPF